MKIKIFSFGRLKDTRLLDLEQDYLPRLPREWHLEQIEIPLHTSDSIDEHTKKRREAELFFGKYYHNEYLVVLDERGKCIRSEEFSKMIQTRLSDSSRDLAFLIGPAQGLSEEFFEKANFRLSLSSFTLPHHFCRLFLIEQLYRAHSILHGHPYHKD